MVFLWPKSSDPYYDNSNELQGVIIGSKMSRNRKYSRQIEFALSPDTTKTGIAIVGTLSTTEMTTDLTEFNNNHFVGRVLIWTSGTLFMKVASITGYDGYNKKLKFTAVTEAPLVNDEWMIV